MEKARKAPRFTGGSVVVILVVFVLVCAAVVGAVLAVRDSKGSSTAVRSPVVSSPPSTEPYGARPGPNGTRILTEPVDPMSLAVPSSWKSPAADALTLPDEINAFAQQAPPLAALLQAEGQVAGKSAIRLFAYQPVAPRAFVSVISFSSPGADAFTSSGTDALVAAARKKASNVEMSGVQLPVGQVLKLDSSLVSQKQPVVVEDLILIAGGRTMLIEMVGETNAAAVPPLFDQIAQSLRLG